MSEDWTGEPPGELIKSATALGLPRLNARSNIGATDASLSPPPDRPPADMTPVSRTTATFGASERKGIQRLMPRI